MPDSPDFSGMFSGAARGIGDNLRKQLWESYQRGSLNISGVTDMILVVASRLRDNGVVFNDQNSFNAFVEDYGSNVASKSGKERADAIQELVSRHSMSNSADKLSGGLAASGSATVSTALTTSSNTDLVPYAGDMGGGGGGGGGMAVASGFSDDDDDGSGGRGGGSRTVLEEIRDALRMLLIVEMKKAEGTEKTTKQIRDYANEQPEDSDAEEAKRRKAQAEREAKWEGVFGDMAPAGGSGSNLAQFGMRTWQIFKKARNRIRRPLGGMKAVKAARMANAGGAGASSRAVATLAEAGGGGAGAAGGGVGAAAGAGGAASAAGAGATAATGVGAAVILMAAAVEFGKAVYQFARAQENEIRRLSEYGAQQSIGVAELDVGRTLRDVKTAQETGGSSRDLMSSLNRFEDALQPIESLLTNIANSIGSGLLDIMTGILESVKPMVEIGKAIFDVLSITKKFKEEKYETNWDILNKIEKDQLEQMKSRLPGPGPAGPRGGPMPYGGKI